jgi:hypothetical protein
MKKQLEDLRKCYESIFSEDIYSKSYIEITVTEDVVLSVNIEGLLLLIHEFVKLCENAKIGNHYHLDEAGMAYKCEKPVVIQISRAPWERDS